MIDLVVVDEPEFVLAIGQPFKNTVRAIGEVAGVAILASYDTSLGEWQDGGATLSSALAQRVLSAMRAAYPGLF